MGAEAAYRPFKAVSIRVRESRLCLNVAESFGTMASTQDTGLHTFGGLTLTVL